MNEKSFLNNTENDQFSMNNEESNYQILIMKLKEISETIALLEKTLST